MTIAETANEKVKLLIGELQIQNIYLKTENEQLKAALEAEKKAKTDGDPK